MTDSLNVIDNKKILLKDVLLDTLPNVESADFALGYFFISGFNVIIEPVKKLNKLRLLISNTTNQQTAEALIEGFKTIRGIKKESDEQQNPNKTKKEQMKKDANENVKQSLELMEQKPADHNVVTQLIEMMKNKKTLILCEPPAAGGWSQNQDESCAKHIGQFRRCMHGNCKIRISQVENDSSADPKQNLL